MRYYSIYGYKGQTSIPYNRNEQYSAWLTIHNPVVDENLFVYGQELIQEDSVSGTFSFKVPLTHPNLSSFDCGLVVEIREFKETPSNTTDAQYGGTAIWIGRLIDLNSDLYGNLQCTCEGPLGFLKDGFMSATNSVISYGDTSILEYIKLSISEHINGNQGEVGGSIYAHGRLPGTKILTVLTHLPEDTDSSYLKAKISELKNFEPVGTGELGKVYRYSSSTPTSVFDFIKEYFETGLTSISGVQYTDQYVWINMYPISKTDYDDLTVPKTEGLVLQLGVDNLEDAPRLSTQKIIFGENILEASVEYDFDNVATSLMVLGAVRDKDEEALTNERYNLFGSIDTATGEIINSFYIDANNGTIDKYGIIQKTVVNDNLKSNDEVAKWANKNRNVLSNPVASFTCKVVDLSTFDPEQDDFNIGEYAEVGFPGLDDRYSPFYYRCTGINKDLIDASKNTFTFRYSREATLTSNTIFKTNT